MQEKQTAGVKFELRAFHAENPVEKKLLYELAFFHHALAGNPTAAVRCFEKRQLAYMHATQAYGKKKDYENQHYGHLLPNARSFYEKYHYWLPTSEMQEIICIQSVQQHLPGVARELVENKQVKETVLPFVDSPPPKTTHAPQEATEKPHTAIQLELPQELVDHLEHRFQPRFTDPIRIFLGAKRRPEEYYDKLTTSAYTPLINDGVDHVTAHQAARILTFMHPEHAAYHYHKKN